MSRDNIRKVMRFLSVSGDRQLRLLGGEPTLHPEFSEIVKEGLTNDFHVHIFSNGMMKPEIAEFLSKIPDKKMSLLCNVSPQAKDSDRKIEKREYALQCLGKVAQVGMTVTSPQFEYRSLIDLVNKFGLRKRIRLGIAQPIVGQENEFLKPSDYRETGRAIVQMVEECIKEDILVGFDCGLTLCMFNREEIGTLMKCSEGFAVRCRPILDIGPDLDVWHCFPLSEVLITALDNFTNRNDTVRYYNDLMKPYRVLGCMPECFQCRFLRRGQCSGGCLAHAMNSLNRLPPRYTIPSKASNGV
jgi:cyclic pyranopterin phosphate synthase